MEGTYCSNGTHGVVDTARAKTTLDNLKATSFAEDHVAVWDSYIVERDLAMTVRCIIITVNRKHSVNGDSLGVSWYQND